VIFFLENNELGVGEYRKLCADKKIAAVVEHDKQNLKSYLLGEIDTCPQIDTIITINAAATSSSAVMSGSALETPSVAGVQSTTSAGQSSVPSTTSDKVSQEKRQRHAGGAAMDQSTPRSVHDGSSSHRGLPSHISR
jgi:hypothetical protein